jgi:hypothetical protein
MTPPILLGATPMPTLVHRLTLPACLSVTLALLSTFVWSRTPDTSAATDPAPAMTAAANAWLASLDATQRQTATLPFADRSRTDWHFIPKASRKGVQLREMTAPQETLALALLREALSQAGYEKSTAIMELDEILRVTEAEKARNIRDPKRYYVTLFGQPSAQEPWGISFEGHHLSLNFTIRGGRVVDSTPQFMGANPAVVKTSLPDLPPAGHRVLAAEETLAFDLLASLDASQRQTAIIAAQAPKEIRAAGEPQSPAEPPVGLSFDRLTADQQTLLRQLVAVYCGAMPASVAAERLDLIDRAADGWTGIRFAWAGATTPGIGHAYRIEGPTFVIEFVNVQPDAEGNPANHIHCVWRDRTGDFDLPAR